MDNEKSRKRIFQIYKFLHMGVYDFDVFAKNSSDDRYLSNQKGDLGWISNDLFDKNANRHLMSLKKNDMSYPIKLDSGWHIFKLLDKRKISKYYEIERNKAYSIFLKNKIILERDNWIKELVRLSYINIINS